MHTFKISTAVQGGFSAFVSKAIPLMIATILTMAITLGINYIFIKDIADSIGDFETSFSNITDIESRGVDNYEDLAQRFEGLESEEEIANEVLGLLGMNFNYNDVEKISADGEISVSELTSLNSGLFSGIGGVFSGFAKMIIGGFIAAVFSLFASIVIGTIVLDAVFNRKFEISNITKNFSRIPSFIFLGILMFLAGLMNIIPVLGWIAYIVFALTVALTPLIILEEKAGALTAMGRSSELMTGNRLKFLLMIIVFAIISVIVSILTLGLGAIVLSPLAACIFGHMYKQLSQGTITKENLVVSN